MILIIILLGLILRIISLNQSLWLDEAISMVSAKNLTYTQIIYELAPSDVHPPGYYLLLKTWISVFGDGEISARLLSVIFGVLLIYVVYVLAKNFFDKKVAFLSSFLMATSPLGVYYSQEIRMYCAAAFFAALSFLFLIKITENKKFAGFFYVVSNLAVLSLDYMAYLIFPAQLIYIILSPNRRFFKKTLGALLISFMLAIPWLTLLPTQIIKGQEAASNIPGWAEVVGGNSFKDFGLFFAKNIIGRISFENKVLYGLIVGSISIIYVYLLYLAWKVKSSKLFFSWLLAPIAFSFAISFILPIFSYHRFIFILPALYILLATGVFKLSKLKLFVTCLLIFVSLVSLLIYYSNPKFQRENWKDAVNFIRNNKSNALVLFEDANIPPPFTYYSKKSLDQFPGLISIPAKSTKDVIELKALDKNREILVFEYLFQINDPNQLFLKKIEGGGYKRINTYDFTGVGFIYEYQYFDRM